MLLFDVGDERLRNVQITSVDVATTMRCNDYWHVVKHLVRVGALDQVGARRAVGEATGSDRSG